MLTLPVASAHEAVATSSQAVLLFRLGERRYGLPLTQVERVLPMASVLTLPEQSSGMLGVLNLHGTVLAVVDPRPRLGMPSPPWTADQRLLVLTTATQRFLLWVDGVEDVVDHAPEAISAFGSPEPNRLTTHVLQHQGELVPILSAVALQECPGGR
jgi:purine-binding chemotaxis protein CheW